MGESNRPAWDLVSAWLVKYGLGEHAGTVMHEDLANQITSVQMAAVSPRYPIHYRPEPEADLASENERLRRGLWQIAKCRNPNPCVTCTSIARDVVEARPRTAEQRTNEVPPTVGPPCVGCGGSMAGQGCDDDMPGHCDACWGKVHRAQRVNDAKDEGVIDSLTEKARALRAVYDIKPTSSITTIASYLLDAYRSGQRSVVRVDNPTSTRVRPDAGGIDGEVWVTLDAQGVAVGIFADRAFAEDDAKTYGDASWRVTGPYRLVVHSDYPSPVVLDPRWTSLYDAALSVSRNATVYSQIDDAVQGVYIRDLRAALAALDGVSFIDGQRIDSAKAGEP